MVPKTRPNPSIRRILCPIDLTDRSLSELRYAIRLAQHMDADLQVVHVAEFFNYKVPVLNLGIR